MKCFRPLYFRIQGGSDCQDCDIFPRPFYVGFTKKYFIISFRYTGGMEHLTNVVDPLALEEYHRIRALQGTVHQSLGIVWCSREHNFKSRNMCCRGCPVLG